MEAEIITIGDEILIGQIVDTNSAWIAQQLNRIGIRVKQISSVSDDRQHILKALADAKSRAGIVLLTGGLGPTRDDITKTTLAEYFGVQLIESKETLAAVEAIFRRIRGAAYSGLLEVNKKQAMVPENCEVLPNHHGTAPGMWFSEQGTVYISMPGVPHEMMYMMEEAVIPRLKTRFALPVILHQTLLTAGEGESYLADKIADLEDALPPHIRLAYLPKLGMVRLRLSAYGTDRTALEEELNRITARITARLGPALVAAEDIPLEKAILDRMVSAGLTLSTAESCTGGYIAHLLTQHPGSSQAYVGGAVTYSDELKQSILGVRKETLSEFGAVSEETVKEMANGALIHFKTDLALAVTGIAGPGGATPEKPVGTVWIAVAGGDRQIVRKFLFGKMRQQNIERTAAAALTLLNILLRELL